MYACAGWERTLMIVTPWSRSPLLTLPRDLSFCSLDQSKTATAPILLLVLKLIYITIDSFVLRHQCLLLIGYQVYRPSLLLTVLRKLGLRGSLLVVHVLLLDTEMRN